MALQVCRRDVRDIAACPNRLAISLVGTMSSDLPSRRLTSFHFSFHASSPYFQHTLKAGTFLSHVVWIMGPLSGLIVAPVVGVLSDRCTSSFGRRRPFILGGMIACIIGMNLFANATYVTFGFLPAARALAVLAFGILDFSTNAIMFPSRALLGDLIPAEEQHSVQSAAAVVASLAEICAGAYISTWKNPVTHVSKVFATASVLMVITCSVSLYMCPEEPLRKENTASAENRDDIEQARLTETECAAQDDLQPRETGGDTDMCSSDGLPGKEREVDEPSASPEASTDAQEHDDDDEVVESRLAAATAEDLPAEGQERNTELERNGSNADGLTVRRELIVTLRSAILNFPKPLIKVGIVYGLAWFVWFASLPFYSQWLGVDVLNGDPHAAPGSEEASLYQRGVSVFVVANAVKATLAMAFSAFYPSIIKFVGNVGERLVFGVSFFGFSAILFRYAYTKSVVVAAMVIAVGSVPFIVTQTIPIAIVVQKFPDNLASNLGVL